MAKFKIPKKIVQLLEEADWICLATRDSNGEPNAANKFLLKCDKDIVYLVDFIKGKTWENVKKHSQVAFPIMDTDNLVDYQLSGMVEVIEKGDIYQDLVNQLKEKELQFSTKRIIEGVRREKGHSSFHFPNINDVVILKIKINDIVVREPSVHSRKHSRENGIVI